MDHHGARSTHDGAASPRIRVLLVEDDAECREILTTLFEMEGISVTATGSGCHAALLVREEAFDVIFTDLGLPDVPGAMLLRELATSARGHPRLAVITGSSDVDIVRARQAGAEVVFRKPFRWEGVATYLSALAPRGAWATV